MVRVFVSIYASLAFLVVNVVILLVILVLNRRAGPSSAATAERDPPAAGDRVLPASDILGWEFEYARVTASEAMQDRHTMVNFYLLVTGVLLSGVVAVLTRETDLPPAIGTVLMWILTSIGWLYFLKILRLRQAWHDSARAMNQIKEFYFQHAKEFAPNVLRDAFRWKPDTLPPPDKWWTVFFYSAMLIAFLDSVAYIGGGALLDLDATMSAPLPILGWLSICGLAFFAFHVWLYFAFLRPPSPRTLSPRTPSPGPPSAAESARAESVRNE